MGGRIGESLDSGFDASHRPGMTVFSLRAKADLLNGINVIWVVQSPG
jgi:hypothetical protein